MRVDKTLLCLCCCAAIYLCGLWDASAEKYANINASEYV